jgi:hypothetical protein
MWPLYDRGRNSPLVVGTKKRVRQRAQSWVGERIFSQFTCDDFMIEALTMTGPRAYISPLGAPPLGAMARLGSPSLSRR